MISNTDADMRLADRWGRNVGCHTVLPVCLKEEEDGGPEAAPHTDTLVGHLHRSECFGSSCWGVPVVELYCTGVVVSAKERNIHLAVVHSGNWHRLFAGKGGQNEVCLAEPGHTAGPADIAEVGAVSLI